MGRVTIIGIFSLDTALFLCNLTDRTPGRYHMTFPINYNRSRPKYDGILCSGSKEPIYSLGVEEILTPGGNSVRAYIAERTMCDILKPRNHTEIQIVTDALKLYAVRMIKNIPLLSEYARALKVEERLRAYLDRVNHIMICLAPLLETVSFIDTIFEKMEFEDNKY